MNKRTGRFLLSLLALCAVLLQAPRAKAVNPSSVTMRVGETRTIYAPIASMATNNGYWTSNSPAVSVSGSGYSCTARAVSATGGLTAILTHHYTEKLSGGMTVSRTQDVRVTVLPPLPTGASVSPGSMTLAVGEGRYLTPSVSPSGADYGSWLYSSENASVARVDDSGYVYGVSPGSVQIKVRTRNEGKAAYCQVTVVPQTCRISFNGNGGSVSPSTLTVTVGEPYGTLPVPERAGYLFEGWYTAPEGGTEVLSSDIAALSGDQTLYAHWSGRAAPAVLGWTAGESSAVILSDPGGALEDCETVFAASMGGKGLEDLAPGKLLGTTVTVNRRLSEGWTLFFLDANGAPVCPKMIIPRA